MRRVEYTVVLEVDDGWRLDWLEKDLTAWLENAVRMRRRALPFRDLWIVGTSIGVIGEE